MDGRLRIPFLAGPRQLDLLPSQQGEADLIYRGGQFYLHQVCRIRTPDPDDPNGWLGVDLGIVNLATDSDGWRYSGGQVNGLRLRHARLRARLQSKGTRSARRLLRKRRGKESRFARDVNHGIALEDLRGIRERITVPKGQRRRQPSWAFFDLRTKIEYKAALAGVSVALIDPHNTSRTCPECGCVERSNRRSQETFSCVHCGEHRPQGCRQPAERGGRDVKGLLCLMRHRSSLAASSPLERGGVDFKGLSTPYQRLKPDLKHNRIELLTETLRSRRPKFWIATTYRTDMSSETNTHNCDYPPLSFAPRHHQLSSPL